MISNKICRAHILRIAFGIMFVTTLLVSNASAEIPVNSCTMISSPGEYALTQDIVRTQNPEPPASCIVITSSDVTLDGQDHSIVGTLIWDKSLPLPAHPSDIYRDEDGVVVSGSTGALTNVIVKNLRVQNWVNGIYMHSISNGMIENIIADHNAAYGIHLANSMNITITNNNAFNNQWIASVNFGDGIFLGLGSNYNTLTGNIANSNLVSGIQVSHSSNNSLIGNTANSNYEGILLDSANNNTLTGNTAIGSYYGISIASANNNLIYGNYFNDTIDAQWAYSRNTWNTDKTAGRNIVGGPFIGGNFWGLPNGRGLSQTCQDTDSDGICDSSTYVTGFPPIRDPNNIDYLPLSKLYSEVPVTPPP